MHNFVQFSADMCFEFQRQFFKLISQELDERSMKNYIEAYKIRSEKTTTCPNCKVDHNET